MIPFCFSAARHLRGWMEPGGRYPFGLRTCNLWPRRVAEKQKQGGARRGSIDMPPLPGFDLDGGSEGRKVIPLKTAKNQFRPYRAGPIWLRRSLWRETTRVSQPLARILLNLLQECLRLQRQTSCPSALSRTLAWGCD